MLKEREMWRAVPDYPNYEVSHLGRLRCKARIDKRGHKRRAYYSKLAPRDGYIVVCLTNEDGSRYYDIHRVMLLAFVGPRPDGMQGCHRNDIRSDNRLENLYWGTPVDNMADRGRNGKTNKGSKHHLAKLDDNMVRMIRQEFRPEIAYRYRALAEKYGITEQNVSFIVRRITWKHVGLEL